jgi:hypothetical protein
MPQETTFFYPIGEKCGLVLNANGRILNLGGLQYIQSNTGTIVLTGNSQGNEIPEPSTLSLLLGLTAASISIWTWRRIFKRTVA